MTSAAQLRDRIEARLESAVVGGAHPFRAGGEMVARKLGLEVAIAMRGVREAGGLYARVIQAPEDARRFRLASTPDERAGAAPVLILADDEAGDLVAFSLKPDSRRVWRWTCGCAWLGEQPLDGKGVLRLRQDPMEWLRAWVKACAYRAMCREERQAASEEGFARARARSGVDGFAAAKALPDDDAGRLAYLREFGAVLRAAEAIEQRFAMSAKAPAGALILDPVALAWTRADALKGVEAIEILDAPAGGPLGRALVKLNPRIGTKTGVPLIGAEPARPQRRAA